MDKYKTGKRAKGEVLTFLSVQSHLFPIRILLTPSEACCSTFACQVLMSERFSD